MREFLKYFLLKFWPNILDDIWHDCKALVRAFRDTREVYKRQSIAARKLFRSHQLDVQPNSPPSWNAGAKQRYKVMRFGHDPIKVVVSKRYPDGTNLYRASLLNLKALNDDFSKAKYYYTPTFVIFIWAIRNILFKRHFKGWFRAYLFKNAQRVKEYTYGYLYSFGSWWPVSALRWFFIRILFRILVNLFFLGPVLKLVSRIPRYTLVLPKFPKVSLRFSLRAPFRRVALLPKVLVYGFFWLTPGFLLRVFDVICRVLVALDLMGVIAFSFIRIVMSALLHPVVLFAIILFNYLFRLIRRRYSLKSKVFLVFLHRRVLYMFHYFSYIFYFKCMLVRHLSSIRIRIRLRRKKPNPIRRFSNWVTYTRYKFSRYQVEKLFYGIGQFLLVLPVRLSKTRTYTFLSNQFFQIIFWRGFPFEKPYLSHFLTEQTAGKFFSYFSIYDDLTLTNFFSNETAFPMFRLIFYEYDDWSANFEEFDELESHVLDMSVAIRSRRKFIVTFVSTLLALFRSLPAFVWRGIFSSPWFSKFLSVPYVLFDSCLGLLSLFISFMKFFFSTPFYLLLYIFAKVKSSKLVLDININRSDNYGRYNSLYFVITAFISLFLFLEFFYIFGLRILLVQEFLMRNLDSYMYNYLFIWLLPIFVLSLVSQYFTEIWREAKYYLLIYPIVVHGWLLFYLIHWTGKKKFGMVGIFADYLNKNSFWFNDALHPILGYFYLNWQPFLKYKRFTSARPYHADQFDLKQATFDFVTSLF